MSTDQTITVEITLLTQEANDVIDENPIYGSVPDDLETTMTRLEALRIDLRRRSLTANLDENHQLTISINHTLSSIKDYIKTAKDYKSKLQIANTKHITEAAIGKERSMAFIITDIHQNIQEVRSFITQDLKEVDDHHLAQIKKDASKISDKLEKISQKYQKLLQSPINDPDVLDTVNIIGNRYEKLNSSKMDFIASVNEEYAQRELNKDQSNKHINIKLDRFNGYESSIDFYTFRSKFEKLYLKTTPTYYLPDLLKNNYLGESPLALVRSINNIDEIWEKLKKAYGDTKTMLSKKLQTLSKSDIIKSRDPEKLVYAISKFTNIIREVIQLAKEHKIENNLYYGDALPKIYQQLGDGRLTRFLTSISDEQPSEKETWERLLTFLEKEERLNQQKSSIQGPRTEKPNQPSQPSNPRRTNSRRPDSFHTSQHMPQCQLCGESPSQDEHVLSNGPGGAKIIQYYTCKEFVDKTPAARLISLKEKGFCIQCLLPGADASYGKHFNGWCQHDFICPHPSHQRYHVKKHVLLCEEHKEDPDNQEVLDKFKSRCMKSSYLPNFSKQIKLVFHINSYTSKALSSPQDSINDRGVYLLQTITLNGNRLNIFYDNGCSDFIISSKAVSLLGSAASKFSDESVNLGGVGNSVTKSKGSYNVTLPLCNGKKVTLSGICLDKITSNFPFYPLIDVEKEILRDYHSNGGMNQLPKLPPAVGGEVHLMIGVKYLRYHPRLVHQLQTGLSLYESSFSNSDGGRGVVGGPHKTFTEIQNSFFNSSNSSAFFTDKSKLQSTEVPLIGYYTDHPALDDSSTNQVQINLTSQQRLFEQVESTGCEITYRCPTCRICKECKHHDEYQSISLKEEVEQSIINSSVTIDLENSSTSASLPFIADPKRLANNKDKAMKVFYQQLRKLNLPANAKDKEDVIESEKKLHQLGYVDYLNNLPEDTKNYLQYHPTQYYIPWRAVWKGNSVSTPCRVVFDASQPTSSGYSLNDLLAKGRNNLNKLQEIAIRWFLHKVGIHTDIRKMYNTIQLKESDWCYQRYIWEPNLDPSNIPEEKIIKTLIYGVRSSGNQAEFGLRKVAALSKECYPEANEVIQHDVYVDDCITGEDTVEKAHKLADDIEVILNKGGFQLKGVSFSGQTPLDKLTDDGKTIHVAGMRWSPEEDTIALNIGDLNFSKKRRGKKPSDKVNIIPSKLTRRHCCSKVAEIFDLTGKVTPIVASMKMDLQELVYRKLDWDDTIPDELRSLWESHFETMREIGNLRFNRAIIPEDAINLDAHTLDFGDASQSMVCSCIYARFERKNGSYSCQLVLSRSKIVPKGMSLPRAELYASLLNAYTGEVVRRSFKSYHKDAIKFTDSQISLFWITNDQKPLKQWVRNRVIEIQRFTTINQWFYIQSCNMIADIGTRKGVSLNEVNQDSTWINGYPWMYLNQTEFPMFTPNEIKINDTDNTEIKKEVEVHLSKINNEVKDHYGFSDYLIDPNQHSFTKVVRIIALVIRWTRKVLHHIKLKSSIDHQLPLTEDEIKAAEMYFYKVGTREVHQFVEPSKYKYITKFKNQILYFTGRILPSNQISITGRFTSAMKDLSVDSFCVPVLNKDSPVAYSIALDTHWNHPVCKHSGVETTLRYILKKVYIIEGRSLVKLIRKNCQRCRYLQKKTVEAVMGPVSESNLAVAPAFYSSQVDLSGPYYAYSPSHKRTTVKIWLTVFCCCTTSAVSIKVMDDYSTDSFIQSFTRFACDYGYPKKLFCDGGSQIVSGCINMKLDFKDLESKLHRMKAIEFSICPVGGHNMHGKVERKIKEINRSIEKNVHNERLSILQWETLSAVIANTINDLPIGIGSKIDVENMDLLTPNRLLLGRNNERSPIGSMILTEKPSKILRENERIYDAWFESWLLNHAPNLMNQTKWYKGDRNVEVGDIVLFKKSDSSISKTYQYGIISKVNFSKDNVVRKVLVRYCNTNEKSSRETYRSIRELVLIQSVEESDLYDELADMSNC